jgi:hypothetical protein
MPPLTAANVMNAEYRMRIDGVETILHTLTVHAERSDTEND